LEAGKIERVRGTSDVFPSERKAQLEAEARLRQVFALYGYDPIDTPVLESTDLFLRKSGEEIASRMYSFMHWNRSLCLRPEFTASVIRAYVSQLQDQPLPVRLQYAGATFRYEKPQLGRNRQFTEVGIECIGAGGPAADAEVLALAHHGLREMGVHQARFEVGHLGAVLELLAQLGMDPRSQSLVLGVMEHLSRAPGEAERVVERLATMLGTGEESTQTEEGALAELLDTVGPEGAARIAAELLERASLSLDGGSRTPSEIVERLLSKTHRPDPKPALRRAIDFIGRLRELAGPPDDALPALRGLLTEHGLHDAPVLEVEEALRYFRAYVGEQPRVHVDLSLARGLRYYTGLVFEVYDDAGNQIAGGGRYDDLVRSLGGRTSIPACGFAFGLERVLAAAGAVVPPTKTSAQTLVVPLESDDYPTAAELGTALRRAGIVVEIDLRFRGPKANLRHADHSGIPLVLLVGERERADGYVTLHDMRAHEEQRIAPADLTAGVLELLNRAERATVS
jgi:histidyl-tRNA synthetase